MQNLKQVYFDRILILLKVFLCLILLFQMSSSLALGEYETSKYKGMNKYQRIGEIEEYLAKFSKELPKQIESKITPLQKKITELEVKLDPGKGNESKLIEDLRNEIAEVKRELLQKINSDVIVLVKKIEDESKANEAARDSLRTALDTKILAIEKIISGFGKVNSLKTN